MTLVAVFDTNICPSSSPLSTRRASVRSISRSSSSALISFQASPPLPCPLSFVHRPPPFVVAAPQAVYRGGVLKPATKLNLPEGATVQVQITAVGSQTAPTAFGLLAGIWSHLIQTEVDQLERALADLRRQTAEKIERLARELK